MEAAQPHPSAWGDELVDGVHQLGLPHLELRVDTRLSLAGLDLLGASQALPAGASLPELEVHGH